MEIWCGVIWKHFESGVPQGHQSLFVCKCVFVRACVSAFVCVSCVCSTPSPGTSAMPPLSQFLTSLLKNMLIQTKPLLSPLLLGVLLGMDWRRHTFITHSQDVWFSTLLFILFFILFQTLFYYSKSSLSPTDFHERWRGKLSIGSSWSIAVSSVFLYCAANVGSLEEMAAASTHGVSQQKALQLASINL